MATSTDTQVFIFVRTNGSTAAPEGGHAGTFSYSVPKQSAHGGDIPAQTGSGRTNFTCVLYKSGTTMTVTRTAPAAGYVFQKWSGNLDYAYSSSDKTISISGSSSSNVTKNVYVDYVSRSYKITLDASGGIGGTSFVNASYLSKIPQSVQVPEYAHHRFLGYFTERDGGGIRYYDADGKAADDLVYTNTAAITLYANWEFVGFSVVVNKVAPEGADYDVGGIGRLRLYNKASGSYEDVETDDKSGGFSFTGMSGVEYLLSSDELPSLYGAVGVRAGSSFVPNYSFTPGIRDDIELSYVIEKKKTYSLSLKVVDASGDEVNWGSSSIASPSEPDTVVDGVGMYIGGTDVVVSASPKAGYRVAGYRITYLNSDGQEVSIGYTPGDVREFTIPSISRNYTAYVVFERVVRRVDVVADDASVGYVESLGASVENGYSGDVVSITARPVQGFGIDGFYIGDERVENGFSHEDGEWRCLATIGDEDLLVRVKCSVSVRMAIEYDNNLPVANPVESCSITVNGKAYDGEFGVALGDSFEYELVLGSQSSVGEDKWIFGAWYNSDDDGRESPTQYGQSGTFYPTSSIDVIAVVMTKVVTNTLTIIAKSNYDASVIPPGGIEFSTNVEPAEIRVTEEGREFEFVGTRRVVVSCQGSVGDDVFKMISLGGSIDDKGDKKISDSTDVTILVNSSITIYVYYGEAGVVTVSFGYGDPSNQSMGEIVIDGENVGAGGDVLVEQGRSISVGVTQKNGFMFVGWFTNRECVGAAAISGADETVRVFSPASYYAYFKPDANAVFEWEGSSDNKVMEWRSKTYVSNRPYNPTTVRADANGYPLKKVSAEMFSSPDSSPTSVCSLSNLASQCSRKLPKGRPERYLQVVVMNDEEVDSVMISTNTIGA